MIICIYLIIYIYIYVCIYIYIHMCTCIFACWNVYTCIHMYIYIYIYIYTHIRYMYIIYVSTLFLQHFFLSQCKTFIHLPSRRLGSYARREKYGPVYIYSHPGVDRILKHIQTFTSFCVFFFDISIFFPWSA